jgi:hypothetical protein
MRIESLQIGRGEPKRDGLDQVPRTTGILSRHMLWTENLAYEGSGGVSQRNRSAGFAPAYLDTLTGVAQPSRYADGTLAPVHVLDGLPPHWVAERDARGRVIKASPGIIAGFLREGRFYTRAEAAALALH